MFSECFENDCNRLCSENEKCVKSPLIVTNGENSCVLYGYTSTILDEEERFLIHQER